MAREDRIPSVGVVLLGGEDLAQLRVRAQLAEQLGYAMVGIGDAPLQFREAYVCLAVVAEATSVVQLGPMVTNPVSRHAAVTAGAASSLDSLTGGRYVLGLGAGSGAVSSLGVQVPKVAEIREAIITIRGLLDGAPSGESTPLSLAPPRRVPIYLAAYGPRTAEVAGEVADGLLYAGGVSAEALGAAQDAIARGAARSGRRIEDIDLWVMARAAVADSRSDALVAMKANLASAGSYGLRSKSQLESVPADLRGAIEQLQARYQMSEHLKWDGANARLLDELGLTEYLANRFAIAGTPAEIRSSLEMLAERGVSRVVVSGFDKDPQLFLHAFAGAAGLAKRAPRSGTATGPVERLT